MGVFVLALLLVSGIVYADVTVVPDNANGNRFFLSEIIYCRETGIIDAGDSVDDGCSLAIEKEQVVSVWNNSKIETGTVDRTQARRPESRRWLIKSVM